MEQTGTIGDLKDGIIDALQGRTDVSDDMIARYVAKTVRELTESQPFPELERTGPNVQLTTNVAEYPVALFVNDNDHYSMPESFGLYVDYPTNSIVSPVRYKTIAGIEIITAPAVRGIPAWFTRFDKNFRFGPVPTQPFTVFLRYQNKHPFSPKPQIGDPLFVPVSWYDIAEYGAAMRIAIAKRWTDQRKELHDLLYGDPEFVNSQGKRGRPGLIAARTFQQERDEQYASRSITPLVSRINPR